MSDLHYGDIVDDPSVPGLIAMLIAEKPNPHHGWSAVVLRDTYGNIIQRRRRGEIIRVGARDFDYLRVDCPHAS